MSGTRSRQRDETRRRLLDAAAACLVEQGSRASLATVADRAGVTTGAVQRHFGTRSGLLLAVFDDITTRQLAAVEQLRGEDFGTDLNQQLRLGMRALWQALDLESIRVAEQLQTAALADPALRAALREHAADVNSRIFASVAEGLGAEVAANRHFSTALAVITVLLRGLATNPAADLRQVHEFLDRAADLIADALTAPAETTQE